jgi:hypothetical protein
MLLIIDLCLIVFAIYRGWLLQIFGLIVLWVIVHITTFELGIDNRKVTLSIDIIFTLIILTMCFYKKTIKLEVCEKCKKPLGDSKYSCNYCGFPLTEQLSEMIKTETTKIIRLIIKNKDDFEHIKQVLIDEYRFLGFKDVVINKENSVMIKKEDAYILATLKGYDLTIETFKTNLPSIINTNINLFVQDSSY